MNCPIRSKAVIVKKNNLDDFIKNGKKKNLRRILGNYQINYLTELDLFIDIISILYVFSAKILMLIREDRKRGDAKRRHYNPPP